jgi:DNA-binding transcriptional ArsR family regulator
MPEQLVALDRVFKALSDPTRRQVVERLVSGPASTSELAAPFDMALPSFSQHLDVLERAGLVTSTKTGRVRTYELAPAALAVADGWLAEQRRLWERRLDQLDDLLHTLDDKEHP